MSKFLITYTKDKEWLKKNYPKDGNGKDINWDDVTMNKDQTESSIKKCLLVEKPNSNTKLIREGLYLE